MLVTVGGTVPGDDIEELKALGVAEVFTPGSSTQAIIDFISESVDRLSPDGSPGESDCRCDTTGLPGNQEVGSHRPRSHD